MRLLKWAVFGMVLLSCGIAFGLQAQRGGTSQPTVAPSIENTTLEVPDVPRPLASMAELLERKLGVPVSYEDAPWVSNEETILSTDHPSNREYIAKNPGFIGQRIPKGGSLSVQLRIDRGTRKLVDPPTTAIQSAIAAHRTKNNPGDFRVVSLGDAGFSIVPTNMRDAADRTSSTQSPFDSRISFPEEDRTGEDTLQTILAAASTASGYQIILGGSVFYPNYHLRLGASNEVARDVLVKMFRELTPSDTRDKSAQPMFAWRLLYTPESRFYGMNIHAVVEEVVTPGGGMTQIPVWRSSPDTDKSK